MLKLTNIERVGENIRANYTPEDSDEVGMLELNGKDIVDSQITSYDSPFKFYLRQAAYALNEIADEPETPKTRLVMWY
jgi:hypothetical protein